ncbi:GIP [Symbiodinium sp. CCMP2456]|nr:GIP [Symbiodinium sp. CCMP2456]
MNGPGKDDERPKLERFDGSDPSMYRRWRRKAELMLLALPNTYTKDRWGAKLLEYVSGEAEEVCESLPLDKLTKEEGHKMIFEALDERYKELDKESLHKHLQEYFYGLKIRPGESYRNLTVRLDTSYRRLKEHAVELPDTVKGWFLLQKLQLEQSAQAMVLTATKGSLKYAEVDKAIQAIFPQGVARSGSNKTKEVFTAEGEQVELAEDETADDVYEAIAEAMQMTEEYDDEEALDVFETYKDIRRRVQEKKLGRGYKGHQGGDWKLTGTVKGKLELLKSKTRCHLCKERGHWKRECPKKGQVGGSGQRQQRPGSSSDAMVADDFSEGYKGLDEEHFLDVDELDKFEIFLAERGNDIDVVVATKKEAMEDDGEVSGDFEHRLKQFFSSSDASKDADVSEAYMADFADVAEHGGFQRTQLIVDLMNEVAGQNNGEMSDLDAKILDEAADLSEDEPADSVPGVGGVLGAVIFNDKKYVSWVRKFIKGRSEPAAGKTYHPTMVQFRLYIALRDQMKCTANVGGTGGPSPSASDDAAKGESNATAIGCPPESEHVVSSSSTARHAMGPSARELELDDHWLLMSETGEYRNETNAERRRRQLREKIEAMTHELEALEDDAEI